MPGSLVILWWDSDVRILGGDGKVSALSLAGGGDPVQAIVRAALDARAASRTVRVVYHPGSLDLEEAACPDTTRARLRRFLSREFPALKHAGTVWSAGPVRRGSRGPATLLCLEKHSALPRLAGELARGGLRVEGAWPLPCLVEATPPCDAPEGSYVALAVLGGRALVACAGPSGDRSVRLLEGPDFAEAALAELETGEARFEDGAAAPGIAVVEEGPAEAAFAGALRARGLARVPMADFLGNARRLSPGRPSDFLRPPPLWERRPSPAGLVAAAGLSLALLALALGARARADQRRTQRQVAGWREEHARLERWVSVRRAARREMDALQGELASLQTPAHAPAAFLEAVGRAAPGAVALLSVTIRGGAFEIRGRVCEEGANPLPEFWSALGAPGRPWRLQNPAPPAGAAEFTLTGSFLTAPEGARVP
jgi:hypothetical protein